MEENNLFPIKLFGALVAFPFTLWSEGFVLSKLWKWYIIPNFNDVPELSIKIFIGISIIVGILTSSSKKEPETYKEFIEMFSNILFIPWFGLVVGYLVKQLF